MVVYVFVPTKYNMPPTTGWQVAQFKSSGDTPLPLQACRWILILTDTATRNTRNTSGAHTNYSIMEPNFRVPEDINN